MYYSPHNEYLNPDAKIVIVGITPGWTQMKTAFQQAGNSLHNGHSIPEILRSAKKAASFSGSMRVNLISMLDGCGVPAALGVNSSETLFYDKWDLLHTTSVIKYPVFHQYKNYTGHRPKIEHSSLLSYFAYEIFPKELGMLKNRSLIIPLGKTVEHVFVMLIAQKELPAHHQYLFGFPHPSGANGHRKKQFEEQIQTFQKIVEKWAKQL
ncbi:hypothetical protein CUU64_02090 [Bacillus sp. V5-8f]|nr:hypothetical protein CUU64_02090 [Bacillus sp. V5-8f]